MEPIEKNLETMAALEKENKFYNNRPIKTLLTLYKGNYLKLLRAFVCFFVKHSPVWFTPIVATNIINIISSGEGDQLHKIVINVSILLVLVLINIPSNYLYIRYISLATRQVESDIRINLVKKLQVLSIPYHKHLQAGRLQAKVLRDVEAITTLSTQFCNSIVPIILNLTVAFTITISKNGSVALFFALSMPACFFIVKLFRKRIRRTSRDFRKNIEEMSATVSQMVEMVPITRAHALEQVEIDKVDSTVHKVKDTGYKVDVLNSFLGSCSWVSIQVLQVACLLFTGYLAYKKEIQVGDIVLYQTYFATVLNQVSAVINIYPEIVKGFESINSVGEIFLAEDVERHMGKKKLKQVEGHFEFNDVSFKYEDGLDLVLDEFNLDVKPGECIAFVGESGGGKTTLLNLLIGFMKPTKGTLLLDGQDMTTLDLHDYRRKIAMVPQNTILFSGTIRDNITYGIPTVSEEKLNEVIEAAALKEVIEKLPYGLETLVGEHGDMLSGGQKQRIAIARALVRDPSVIILDEATSALDNQSEMHIQQAMKNLIKGRTTFVVAHRLSTIIDSDRIVVVSGGKNIENGSYEELMAKQGAFYELAKGRIG